MHEINRRNVIAGFGAMIAASVPPMAAGAHPSERKLSRRLGIQLYMLGTECDRDLPGTLKQVSDIGFREVELAGFHGRSPEEMRKELDAAGLVCPSVHTSVEPFMPGSPSLTNLPAAIASFKAVGATNAVVAMLPFIQKLMKRPDARDFLADHAKATAAIAEIGNSMSADDWKAFARLLNEKGAAVAAENIRLSYHNHNVEFAKLANGQTAYDLLLAETDPKFVSFELDIGWAASAGQDPVALLKRYRDRIIQLHVKDLAASSPATSLGINSVNIGDGVIDWKSLIALLPTTKIEHLYVEQEPPFPSSAMDAAHHAFAFLEPRLAKAGA